MTAPEKPRRQSPGNAAPMRWTGFFPIALVVAIGVGISVFSFREVTAWEVQRVRDAFREDAQDRVLVIQREIENTLGVVRDIGSFFGASRRVTRRAFREFVGPAVKRLGSVAALEWIPWVPGDEREAFEAEARRGFSRFRITEHNVDGTLVDAGRRSVNLPILYVQPYPLNKAVLGLDLAADARELAALEKTRDLGWMTATPILRIRRDGRSRSGFAVRLPVYRRDPLREQEPGADAEEAAQRPGIPMTLAERRRLLRGFAAGEFLVREIVEGALENLTPSGIDIHFYGNSDQQRGEFLYTHVSRLVERGGEARTASPWRFDGILHVADREWSAVCMPVPGRYAPDLWNGWFVLVAGLAFTVLLTVYLATLLGRAAEVRRLVAKRTTQLVAANSALNTEIGERKRAERELQRLNETLEQRVAMRTAEAERRAEELGQFAYVASHDLKAPLRAIANLADWIGEDLRGKLDADTAEALVLLRDRVGRMHALIEGLLEYSRVGRVEGAAQTVNTKELLGEVIDSLAPPPGILVEVAEDMPILATDRLQLGQVFANLIGNSVKHRRSAQGHVWISARDLGRYYEFTVADDGPGIAAEYHDKVFMMFQTLETRDFDGDTGIGLALVKKIVQEHGGSVTLTSAQGQGATFRFTWQREQ